MKAHVEAYGCTLNFGEAREIEALQSAEGWELVDDPEGCDLEVLATCAVVEKTERAMLKRLSELKDVPRLVVSGCMATACRENAESVASRASFVPPGDVWGFSRLVEEVSRVPAVARPSDDLSYGTWAATSRPWSGRSAHCLRTSG